MQTGIGKQQILQIKPTEAGSAIVVVGRSLTSARWPRAFSALHSLSAFIWFLCTAVVLPASQAPCRFCFFYDSNQNGLVISSNLDFKGQGTLSHSF